MVLNYYLSELRNSLPQDYQHLDTRLLTRILNQFRTIYIKNQYNQNRTIDENLAQEIDFQVDITDQSTIGYINTTDRILKSKLELPNVVKLSHRDMVLSVRNPKILADSYNFLTKSQAVYAGNGRFNKEDIFAFLYKNHLYLKLKKENPKIGLITVVSMFAIFEDPLECIPFQTNEYVDPRDYEYPMTDTIWGYVKANILRDGMGAIQANLVEEQKQDE